MIQIFHDKTGSEYGYPNLAMPLLEPLLVPGRMNDAAKSATPSWLPHYQTCDKPEQADVFMLVCDLAYYVLQQKMQIVQDMLQLGQQFNKPVWVFSGSDFGITPADNRLQVLRLGGHASGNSGNQYVMPPFIVDPLKQAGVLNWQPIDWNAIPTVGFCGQADEGIARQFIDNVRNAKLFVTKKMGRNPYDLQPFFSTTALRGKVLSKFESATGIHTDFLKRKKYKAGARTAEDAAKTKKEYYENVYNNAYTVCLRGAGNYSIRFYDCIAAGRIPAFINTDCMLPLPNIINWQKHCFVQEHLSLEQLETSFLAYHQAMDAATFSDLQLANRQLWENYLTYDGFFSHFHLLPPNQSFAGLY